MGQFQKVIDALVGAYKRTRMFAMVSADAGSCSEENGRHVRSKNLHYIFGLKGSQPTRGRTSFATLIAAREIELTGLRERTAVAAEI